MHPVQAAPRQSCRIHYYALSRRDAPRAGSAEAKLLAENEIPRGRMHPVQAAPRQRNGCSLTPVFCSMHPVQAAPRQRMGGCGCCPHPPDAPRAGSAEAKFLPSVRHKRAWMHPVQAAPRQSRKHKGRCTDGDEMHPVQAAPRQRSSLSLVICLYTDAPRAGSAEAKP